MEITSMIDADIHPAPDPTRVAERLPEPWRRRYLSGNRGPGYLNYWNPNGVHRADAVTENGERIEGSAVHLARHFFDVYKTLEKKSVQIGEWKDVEAAQEIVNTCRLIRNPDDL